MKWFRNGKNKVGSAKSTLKIVYQNPTSAVPRRIFIPLNWYGRPKNEPKFLKTLTNFF